MGRRWQAVALALGKLTHGGTGGQPTPRTSVCLGPIARLREEQDGSSAMEAPR
jgi:hypothetical protein